MITSSCCLSTVIHASSSDLSYFHCHKGLSVIFLLYGCCVFLFLISSHLSLCTSFWSDEFLIWVYHVFVQSTEHVHSLLEWCVFDLSIPHVCSVNWACAFPFGVMSFWFEHDMCLFRQLSMCIPFWSDVFLIWAWHVFVSFSPVTVASSWPMAAVTSVCLKPSR